MIPLKLFAKAALIISIFFSSVFAEGSLVEIITPKENHLQSELTLNVVLSIDKKRLDSVEIGIIPDMKSVDMSRSQSTACANISLSLGENRVLVRAYKDGVLIKDAKGMLLTPERFLMGLKDSAPYYWPESQGAGLQGQQQQHQQQSSKSVDDLQNVVGNGEFDLAEYRKQRQSMSGKNYHR